MLLSSEVSLLTQDGSMLQTDTLRDIFEFGIEKLEFELVLSKALEIAQLLQLLLNLEHSFDHGCQLCRGSSTQKVEFSFHFV